jgi:hypothetical protein
MVVGFCEQSSSVVDTTRRNHSCQQPAKVRDIGSTSEWHIEQSPPGYNQHLSRRSYDAGNEGEYSPSVAYQTFHTNRNQQTNEFLVDLCRVLLLISPPQL